MIIRIESTGTAPLEQAQHDLNDLASTWGHQITATSPGTPRADSDGKSIDPVAIASLAVSLPSAALAVADLADRIRKRHRAAELIDHARQQAARQVTLTVITPERIIQLTSLAPDQLLDLQASGEDAS